MSTCSNWRASSLAITVILVIATVGATQSIVLAGETLPRPAGLEPDIGFWRKIIGEVTTNEALVHDNR